MRMQIRRAQTKDAGAIAEILRTLGWFAHLNSEPYEFTRERVVHHLELSNADNSHSVHVAESSTGETVGYIAVHWQPTFFLTAPEGFVSEVFVLESERGQGIGTRLLEVVKKEAKERGCSRLMLMNWRTDESYKRGFYKKRGWEERPAVSNLIYPLL